MPIDPLFGIQLDADDLTNNIPMAPLYLITPNNKFIPARSDALGRLEIGAVTLDLSDIQIGAVELKDHTTDDRVHVTPDNEARTEARLHDGAGTDLTSTLISGDQALDVNIVGFGGGGGTTENDDDDIAPNLTRPANINLLYAFKNTATTRWERLHQTDGRLHSQLFAGATALTVTGTALDVNVTSPLTIDVNLDNANDDVLVYGFDGAANRAIKTDVAGELQIDVLSSALPTGAATETTLATLLTEATFAAEDFATEATQATLLTEATFVAEDFATEATLGTLLLDATFTSRINTLGQKAMAASTPVVLASDQSPIDVVITAGGGGPEVTDAATLAGSLTAVRGVSLNYGWDGATWQRINSTSNRMLVDGSGVTQPISAVLLPLPAGASTSALQTSGNLTLSNIETILTDNTQITRLGDGVGLISTRITTGANSLDVSALNFGFTGSAWETINSTSNRLNVDNTNNHTVDDGTDLYIAGTSEGSLSIGRVIDVDALPTLTIGQISGLTLDLGGALRITEGNPDRVTSPENAAENDQAFSATAVGFNLGTAGTETPVMLIRNPGASTVTLYLNTLSVNNDVKTQTARINLYKSPTVTVAGIAILPSNFKVGSVVVSQITPFSGSTISANGVQLATFATGANQNDLRRTFEFAIIVPPNSDLLVTGIGSNNNTLIALGVEWAEV